MGPRNGALFCLVVEGPSSGKTPSGSQTVSDTVGDCPVKKKAYS